MSSQTYLQTVQGTVYVVTQSVGQVGGRLERCGRTGLLEVAAGSSLVVTGVFGVSVWDTSRVLLVGDELSLV